MFFISIDVLVGFVNVAWTNCLGGVQWPGESNRFVTSVTRTSRAPTSWPFVSGKQTAAASNSTFMTSRGETSTMFYLEPRNRGKKRPLHLLSSLDVYPMMCTAALDLVQAIFIACAAGGGGMCWVVLRGSLRDVVYLG